VNDVIKRLSADYPKAPIKVDDTAVKLLIKNLNGLSASEAEQIAKKAIRNQAITVESLPDVEKAKYELLNRGGVIYFEYGTKQFSDIGGFKLLKKWLDQRRESSSVNKNFRTKTCQKVFFCSVFKEVERALRRRPWQEAGKFPYCDWISAHCMTILWRDGKKNP